MAYDIVGDVDLVGDAVDDLLRGADGELEGYGEQIIGAPRRGMQRPPAAQLRESKPNRLDSLALGIGVTSVAATSSAVVTVTPQVPFRLQRFLSPTASLSVNDIKVGTNSQFVGAGSIPIEAFANNSVGVGLKGDTAVPGVDIALYVSNPTAGAISLSGAYFGAAAT